jgi:hypothetical protein
MSRLFIAIGVFCFLLFLATATYGQTTVTLTIRSQYGTPDPSVGTHTYTLNTWVTASVATPVAGSPPP